MKTLIYFVSILAFCSSSFATPPASPKETSSPTIAVAPQSISQAELELRVLKMQAATMKEYHSSLLDTVYWALGTVATVAALLVGFGWFANFKFHESEKQRLKEELDARLKEALGSIDTRLSVNEVEVIKSVDLRLDSHLTRTARDIDIARAEASRMHQDNADAVRQLRTEIVSLQQAATKNEKRDSELEATLRLVEEHVWNLKGIPTNTLITQSQGLRSAINAEHRYYIASALDRMQTTIKDSILPSKKTISKSILSAIREDIAKAANIEPVAAAKVSELLEKIELDPEDQS